MHFHVKSLHCQTVLSGEAKMYEVFYRILVTNLTFYFGIWIGYIVANIHIGYKRKWSIAKILKNILFDGIVTSISILILTYLLQILGILSQK
jgi:hypothetical protein